MSALSDVATFVWERDHVAARLARAMLRPAEAAFAAGVARRNARYDTQGHHTHDAGDLVPAISVGNLTVGGTGKTPVAAWCVAQLQRRGARPAVVLRGYGDDEWRVHELLSPGAPVVVSADRTIGMAQARARGADCAVLDDAFQHRRAPRVADLVLVSADRWQPSVRLLPAGPYREPFSALRRADIVVVTVKAATERQLAALARAVQNAAPDVPVAVLRLVPGGLQGSDDTVPASPLAGRSLFAVSAIGDPDAYEAQLRGQGSELRGRMRFTDHHAYSEADALRIAQAAARAGATDGVVCTLKDAVKLRPLWPRAALPLWYVSQSVVVDRGAEALDRAVARVLAARATTDLTAG